MSEPQTTQKQVVKPEEFIVGPEIGSLQLDGDPKKKWYQNLFTGSVQLRGWGVMFFLTVLTSWYTRTYGLSGWIRPAEDAAHASVLSRVVELPLTHQWTMPLSREKNESWQIDTLPLDAALDVKNADTGEEIHDFAQIPSHWRLMSFRINANDARAVTIRITPR